MKSTRFRILISIFVAGILGLIAVVSWWVKEPLKAFVAIEDDTPSSQHASSIKKNDYLPRDDGRINKGQESTKDPPLSPLRLRSIAQHSYVRVMNSRSLGVDPTVVELLDLNRDQVVETNKCLKRFLSALKTVEFKHATVRRTEDGGEEIVVEPFDRSGLLDDLRRDLREKTSDYVANFIVEQAPYDDFLALVNSEMRLSIEHSDDGLDRFVVTQLTLEREENPAHPSPRRSVNGEPASLITSKGLLGREIDPRFAHLFSAIDNLPRR